MYATTSTVTSKMNAHISSIVLLLLICSCTAHSSLSRPAPYSRVFKTRHCRGAQCTNACPDVLEKGMQNTARNPAQIWARGQQVMVTYVRNSHRAGMVRLALVPVSKRMDRAWHKRLAFMYGCWESGARTCRRGEYCGTDGRRITFDRKITVPDVFPDGDYLLGFVWFGGVKHGRGLHPDWYSCSHIRIQGGGPVASSFRPYFEAGPGEQPAIRNGKCKTAMTEAGSCVRFGCKRKYFYAVPKDFSSGSRPALITSRLIEQAFEE